MKQSEDSNFFMEDALEMILMFDRSGDIFYANAAAKKKLEYDNDLCGRHISEVFPNTFPADADEAEGLSDKQIRSLVAYRGNHTCFPVEARILKRTVEPAGYICMANDILEKEFLGREIERIQQEAEDRKSVV